MSQILEEIVANTRKEVQQRIAALPLAKVEAHAATQTCARDFTAALTSEGVRIIAECKKRSPSKGLISNDYQPVKLARLYEGAGAAAISVLTDAKYFGGHLDDLSKVREAVSIPVLRKDFIIDPYQIYEARAAGADSFLLLSGVLDTHQLQDFIALGRTLGMEPLVESHTASQLEMALASGARILGINNRNLATFEVDLEHARSQIASIRNASPDLIPVCESGIKTPSDISQMTEAGYQCFLIGETLVKATDPAACLALLCGRP